MLLRNYIENLSSVQTLADKLADVINCYVKIFVHDCYCEMKIYSEHDLVNTIYQIDFNTIEELQKHIEQVLIGAKLAKGIEI